MPFLTFAPGTKAKSAEVNSNFTNAVHKTDVEKIENKVSVPSVVEDNAGAFDLDLGSIFVRTLDGSNNTLSLTNETVGQVFQTEIIQDATGPTWWSGITWTDDVVPASSASGKRDVYGFRVLSAGTYYGVVVARGM